MERELKVKVVQRREKEVQKAEVELGLHMVSGQHRGFEAGSVGRRAINEDAGSLETKVTFQSFSWTKIPFRHRSSDIGRKCPLVDRRGLKCSSYSLSLPIACSLIHHLESINNEKSFCLTV